MNIVVKRIKYTKYDELEEKISKDCFFDKNANPILGKLEEYSEPVTSNNRNFTVDINTDELLNILSSHDKTESKEKLSSIDEKVAELLYNSFAKSNPAIPNNVLCEKEVWAYLNLSVFFDYVQARYFSKTTIRKDIREKIKEIYFSDCSKVDRRGLQWLWTLAKETKENGFNLTLEALENIDPVKAIRESCIGENTIVFKAFIKSLILVDKDPRNQGHQKYTNDQKRTIIPKHIRNLAVVNIYEAYDNPEDLAKIMADNICKLIF
jgi:hypothetical protein